MLDFNCFRSLEKINQTKEEIEKQRKFLQRRKPPSDGKHGKQTRLLSFVISQFRYTYLGADPLNQMTGFKLEILGDDALCNLGYAHF